MEWVGDSASLGEWTILHLTPKVKASIQHLPNLIF